MKAAGAAWWSTRVAGLGLLLGASAVQLGCGAAVHQDPESVLHSYARLLEDGRADEAYRLLSDEARRGISLEAFRRMVKDDPDGVREIGKSLEISVETVKEHVQNILRKIAVSDRTQAAVWAVRRGLV